MKLGDHVLYQMNDGSYRTAVVTTRFDPFPCLSVFLVPGKDFMVYGPDLERAHHGFEGRFALMKRDSVLMENFPENLILESQAIATVEHAQQGYSPGQWHVDAPCRGREHPVEDTQGE